ncbi:MAG TPA: dephospho-CoA kinase [Candidatus Limnocylindrales bacterium]|nr:dephospho-CoA kinase [Candidatus Limnocylindrales bacterium]
MSGGQAPRAVRIGLTGPIGCGKSTVAGWLAEAGAATIDADKVARDVVRPGEPALARVLEAFGPSVRRADGSLDRAALGRIVFRDPAALARLEAIVHPAVRPRILAAIAAADEAGSPAVVIEAIKLVEGGLAALCDEVWLLVCDHEAQRARLAGRGVGEADADARIGAQDRPAVRLRDAATRIIDTSSTPEATRRLVAEAYETALAGRGPASRSG